MPLEVLKRTLKRKGVLIFIFILSIIGTFLILNKKERGSAFDFPAWGEDEKLYKPNNFKTPEK